MQCLKLQTEMQSNIKILDVKSLSNKENYNDKSKDCTEKYHFRQLKNDLQNRRLNISSSWSYTFEQAAVKFAYVHPVKFAIQVICRIDNWMNVKVLNLSKLL